MGLQHTDHDKLMRSTTENATTTITELDLETAASTQAEADRWKHLSQEMKYILTSVTSGGAAAICRQYQQETGYEILRQRHRRYSIPVGTRSMGYLTKLLKPTLDPNNFEESFAHWEYGLTMFERDNSTTLPDQAKIAILLNETTGPLQQHLQLLAGTNQTYAAIRQQSQSTTEQQQHSAECQHFGSEHEVQWRSSTDGHRSHRKEQGLQRKRLQQRKRLREQRQGRQRTRKRSQRSAQRKAQEKKFGRRRDTRLRTEW